jgi:uncharacterized membrane protein
MVQHESSGQRRLYIDWARAIAVLLMIEAHTFDAWASADARRTVAFRNLMVLGGFAAPLFLWLAGISLVLYATGVARRTGRRSAGVEAVCRRGLEIFVLAFLFRLQALIVTPGGHLVSLFRVDILNILGASMAAAGLVWGLGASTRALVSWFTAAAVAVAMLTPVVRASPLVDDLPIWVQWYLRPAGDATTFTALPWAGFVFAGAAVGAIIAPLQEAAKERRLQMWLVGAGWLVAGVGFYTAGRPTIYRDSSFWTSSPTYFAIRVGVMMAAFAALAALVSRVQTHGSVWRPVERFGRSSLFIYWIHVELVYGYASWPLHGHLPLALTFAAFTLFTLLMYCALLLRDRALAWWSSRTQEMPQTLPAWGWPRT